MDFKILKIIMLLGLLLFVSTTARAAYVGPGDIKSGAVAWYSCSYAYNAAYSTGTNKGCRLFRSSDSTTEDIDILSSGEIDVATALSFCTHGTATATASGTTLTISTVLTGSISAGDQVIGTGVEPDTYIVSGSSSPYTIANSTGASQPSTGSITVTLTDCRVDEAYDQSGALACGGVSCDVSVSTTRPYFSFDCLDGTVPCMSTRGDTSGVSLRSAANSASINQPFTFSVVYNNTSSVNLGDMIADNNVKLAATSTPNVELFCGSGAVTAPISVATWYMGQVGANGVNGIFYVNQVPSILNCGSTGISAGTISLFSDGNNFLGQIAEAGEWNTNFSFTDDYNMTNNQATRYGLSFTTNATPPTNPSCITGVSQPALAAAQGFNCLAFYDNFASSDTIDTAGAGASGYNWYPQNFFMNFGASGFNYTGTPQSDYSVASNTLTVSDTPGAGMGLNTAGPTQISPQTYGGRVFNTGTAGYYIKFKLADNWSLEPGAQRLGECNVGGPIEQRYYGGAVWMQPLPLFYAQTTHTSAPGLYGEIDLFENVLTNGCSGGTVAPDMNVHYWTDWDDYNEGCQNAVSPAGPWDGVTFHTEEDVILPSSGVTFYHDGSQIASCSWSAGSTLANSLTNSPQVLVIAPGLGWPMLIQDVEIWTPTPPIAGGRMLIR
jgi:hypothetical protein